MSDEGRLVLMFGPPGSGKSTHGDLVAEKMGWDHASSGPIIKEFADQELMDRFARGELATDAEINPVIDKAVRHKTAGGKTLVLDGYPRNLTQAERMLEIWPKILVAVMIRIPDEEVHARIHARNRDEGDSEEATKRRIEIFNENIEPIKKMLEDAGVIWIEVNGEASIDEVHERVMAGIKNVPNI